MSGQSANKKRYRWVVELTMDMLHDESSIEGKKAEMVQRAVSKGASPDVTFALVRNDHGGATLYVQAVEA